MQLHPASMSAWGGGLTPSLVSSESTDVLAALHCLGGLGFGNSHGEVMGPGRMHTC